MSHLLPAFPAFELGFTRLYEDPKQSGSPELVPENENVRSSTPPKSMASSIKIGDAILQAANFSNGYPKWPVHGMS